MDGQSLIKRVRDLAAEVDGNEHVLVPFNGGRFLEELADRMEWAIDEAPGWDYDAGDVVELIAEKIGRG